VSDPPRVAPPTRAAAIAFVVLLVAFVVVAVIVTPWHPLPGHVPGGAVDPDPARDFTAAEIARESAYHSALRPWGLTGLGISILLAVLLVITPIGARLLDRVVRGRWLVRVVLAAVVVTAFFTVVSLPFAAHAHHVQRAYGLSTQTWGAWWLDVARGYAVSLVSTVLALIVVMAIARRWPRRWWVGTGLAGAVLVVVGSFVYPVLVEPVFNNFTPLPPGQLRTELLDLAARDGVHLQDILVADASRRTTADNAYVSGFGASRRLVLYDTLLRHDTPAQVRVITAHELGHVKHHDVIDGTLLGALAVAAGMCGAFLLFRAGAPLPRRLGVDGAADPRVVPALVAAYVVVTFLTTPVTNLVSRHIEAHADAHSLELTRDPTDFIAAQHDLAVRGLDDVDPPWGLYVLFSTHPTAPQRIAMARDWEHQHPASSPTSP
jgi:STE24 endopeptidase